ncbi:hypothetical protein SDJN03_26599, partial [Cucurbita argyrosperma subsp. sororia]
MKLVEVVSCGDGAVTRPLAATVEIGGSSVGGDGIGEKEMTTCEITDVDYESADLKKQMQGVDIDQAISCCCRGSQPLGEGARLSFISTSLDVADRINEKMKALQELIPRCKQ